MLNTGIYGNADIHKSYLKTKKSFYIEKAGFYQKT